MNPINYIFPRYCLICSKLGEDICDECIKRLIHKLPSCCICKRLNNNYFTHRKCSKISIQFFTGWYLTEDIELKLRRKRQYGLFSIYEYLLKRLILYLDIQNILDESNICPIFSYETDEYSLNKFLSKSLLISKRGNGNILFVGGHQGDIEGTINRIKGLPSKEPLNVRFLTLFELNSKRRC